MQLRQPAAMKNLFGDLWSNANTAPDWTGVWGTPGANLHLYGKATARRGRKMGHLTVLERTPASAVAVAERLVRDVIRRPGSAPRPNPGGSMTTCSC
jgi:5-(carboxyamino)imidazole ribonucleotide synthase